MDERANISLRWIQDLCSRVALEGVELINIIGEKPPEIDELLELSGKIATIAQELEGKLTVKPEPVEEPLPAEPEAVEPKEGEPDLGAEGEPDVSPASPSSEKPRPKHRVEKKRRRAAPHG